jgi:hypothetical protein
MERRRLTGIFACLVAILSLSACYISHPRFGAGNFERTDDFNGLPTYYASGSIGYEDKPEPVVERVIHEACPNGNPKLVSGQAMANKGQDRYGFPVSGKFWMVTFTCDQIIPPE